MSSMSAICSPSVWPTAPGSFCASSSWPTKLVIAINMSAASGCVEILSSDFTAAFHSSHCVRELPWANQCQHTSISQASGTGRRAAARRMHLTDYDPAHLCSRTLWGGIARPQGCDTSGLRSILSISTSTASPRTTLRVMRDDDEGGSHVGLLCCSVDG